MKMKKVGAILAGAALLGATFAAAVTADAHMDVPDRDFFIDVTTGLNNCLIVVGSGAAAADVVSAAYVAAQIGSMAYYEDIVENWAMPGVTYTEEDQVDNYWGGVITNGDFEDYLSALPTPQGAPHSSVVLPYACYDYVVLSDWGVDDPSMIWWDYDVYVDAYTLFGVDTDDNFLVYTDCSYEAITVDFSLRDVECTAELCIGCSAACDQGRSILETRDLLECQSYPNVYPRHYWGTPEVYADAHRDFKNNPGDEVLFCDPVGGIQYRTIVDYFWEEVDAIPWAAIVGPESEAYMVCDPHYPVDVWLYCSTCDVYFLGKHYDAISFGTDANGYDYMFYGTPNWFVEEKLAVGESKDYNGWVLTINDLNIYENKIHLTITSPEGDSYTYISVINTYTSNVPSNGDGDMEWYTAGANEENDTLAFLADTFEVYTICGEPDGEIVLQEECICQDDHDMYGGEVIFAVKFIKTFIGAAGNYVVEYHAYDLEDYGVLKEQIYPGPCDTPIEPAIRVGDLEWYFDIFPADNIDALDLDNDVDLYAEGNPNFDVADAVSIIRRGAGGPICVPMLELWLATPVELAGLCDDEMTIALNDCEGNNYFTMVVTDEDHTDYIIDGTIDIYRKIALAPTVTKVYKEIDPESLVKLDESIDAEMKNTYNLVLIGGPVANSLVQELVDLGKTTFEQWENATEGALELLEDAYAVGKDVLIVAGSDRDATAMAALDLIAAL